MLKKYTIQFIKVVHPDLFSSSSASIKASNLKSLQNLQMIISKLTNNNISTKIPENRLIFYCKTKNGDIPSTVYTEIKDSSCKGWKEDSTRKLLEMYANAGISINAQDFPELMNDKLKGGNDIDSHLSALFTERLSLTKISDPDLSLKSDVRLRMAIIKSNPYIFYHEELMLEEKAEAILRLADVEEFVNLKPSQLKRRPLLICRCDGLSFKRPFLLVPYNFDRTRLLKVLS